MKKQLELLLKIRKLKKIFNDYQPEAYSFVLEALEFTMKKLSAPRHLSGQEFLEGIRLYALEQFGAMARTVFEHWGIKSTLDFGQIVFDLVDAGLLRKREDDLIDDFKNGFDFKEAFDQKFNFSDS